MKFGLWQAPNPSTSPTTAKRHRRSICLLLQLEFRPDQIIGAQSTGGLETRHPLNWARGFNPGKVRRDALLTLALFRIVIVLVVVIVIEPLVVAAEKHV